MIKTVKSVDLKDKRIIMRVDFNVPMKDGVVQDDTRIVAAIPTIKYILAQGAKTLTLMSHLGDPAKDSEKARAKAEKDAALRGVKLGKVESADPSADISAESEASVNADLRLTVNVTFRAE
jgi:3-phosphoglycerate kinase